MSAEKTISPKVGWNDIGVYEAVVVDDKYVLFNDGGDPKGCEGCIDHVNGRCINDDETVLSNRCYRTLRGKMI